MISWKDRMGMIDWEMDLHVNRMRFKVLKHLGDYNNIHPFVSLERAELLKELEISEYDLDESIKSLEDEMLIETVWFMGGDFWTKISNNGVEAIYEAEKNPKSGTKHFPPVHLMRNV